MGSRLSCTAETTLYRWERWETPDGETLIAPLGAGIVGGCGPHLHRFVLMLHFEGQTPCERIVALLAGLGLTISKRQVVRLLTAKLNSFRAEDEAVLSRRPIAAAMANLLPFALSKQISADFGNPIREFASAGNGITYADRAESAL